MSKRSKHNALEQQIKALSGNIKTTEELEDLTRLLRKTTLLEAMLEGELEDHLGYPTHDAIVVKKTFNPKRLDYTVAVVCR